MGIRTGCKIPGDLLLLLTSGRLGDLADGALLDRFLATRDEAAFEALMMRHGPMVHRVCLSTLVDANDVDDAFQAVFLVLVRSASAIRSRESLASWLHGVASRVSTRANAHAALRRTHERRSAERTPETATKPPSDAIAAVHEEVSRLPERYREAVVLCYLEDHTCDQAARRIGRPVGTVKARLSRARGLLKERLLRRGVSLSAALIASGAEAIAANPVSRELFKSTLRTTAQTAATPNRVRLLAQGVIGSMQMLRIKLLAVCVMTAALGTGAVMASRGPIARADEPGTQAKPASAPPESAVRLALKQALPAAIETADPYRMTFVLIRLARAQNSAGDRPSALETFALADRVADKVQNQHLRRLALMRTAVARGRIGDSVPARATLDGFAREGVNLDPEARYNMMSMVIDFLFQAGFKDEARATLANELAAVEAIKDERLKEGGIYRLLYSQVTLLDYDGALRQAERYTGDKSNTRASLLQVIMTFQRENDARPSKDVALRALELSREITAPYPRALAQRDIAAALARVGDLVGALAIVQDIGKGDPEVNHVRASEIPPTLVEIAKVQGKEGATAAAIETLRKAFLAAREMTPKDGLYTDRVRMIAEAQSEVGDVEGAKTSVVAIANDAIEKALALAALARAQAKVGDRAGADASLREAANFAKEIRARANFIDDNPAENADRVYREIVVAHAEIGDATGALAVAAGRGADAWKSELLGKIAPIQARLGDIDGARSTATLIPDPTLSAEAFGAIASHQARAGDVAKAMDWASRLESPIAKAIALVGMTEGLASRASDLRKPRTP